MSAAPSQAFQVEDNDNKSRVCVRPLVYNNPINVAYVGIVNFNKNRLNSIYMSKITMQHYCTCITQYQ